MPILRVPRAQFQLPDHARAADAGMHFKAPLLQQTGHQFSGIDDVEARFRMRVDLAAQIDKGLFVGDHVRNQSGGLQIRFNDLCFRACDVLLLVRLVLLILPAIAGAQLRCIN